MTVQPPSPVMPQGTRAKTRLGVGIAIGSVAGFLVATLLACLALATGGVSVGSAKREGPGFESATQAAREYLAALQRLDLTAMNRAFAIESYAEACDGQPMLERLKSSLPEGSCVYSKVTHDALTLNTQMRATAVQLANRSVLTTVVSPTVWNDGRTQEVPDAEAAEEYLSQVDSEVTQFRDGWGSITQIEASEVIDESKYAEHLSATREFRSKEYGVAPDDLETPVFVFELRGQECYFAPLAVRYNGRWYLAELVGPVTTALNIGFPGLGPIG